MFEPFARRSVLLAALTLAAASGVLSAQKRAPVPSTAEQRRLIEEGNELHDHQDVDGAMLRYAKVLQENPDNVDALFESASCYYEKGGYDTCLALAQRGAEYASVHLGSFYVLVGTCHDALRHAGLAEAAFREGLLYDPDNFLLLYNLGVTLAAQHRFADAAANFERALRLNPNHTGSHVGLAYAYTAQGNRIPALLALMRALVLEPESPRVDHALATLASLLGLGRQYRLRGDTGSDRGDFRALNAVVAGFGASSDTMNVERVHDRFKRLIAALAAARPGSLGNGFAATYYVPYVAEVVRAGYGDAFFYVIHSSRPAQTVRTWLEVHRGTVVEFRAWSRTYQWPAEAK